MSTTVSEATSLEATASSEARPRRRKAVGINARHNGVAFLFLSPWLVGLMFLTLGPILASFYLSLDQLRHVHAAAMDRAWTIT